MFATSASLTGNPGIEWTYCNGTPATNTLTHTHRSIKQSNNSMREKQVYVNISPSASPLALGSAGPGPDHSVLTYSIRLSVVSPSCCSPPTLALWLEESASRQLLLRAPTCGISTFKGEGQDSTQPWWVRHYWRSHCQVETSMGFAGCIICKFGETCVDIWLNV